MKCKITGRASDLLFKAKVLGKYDVEYFRCPETGFIQTEEPYWLDEAYSTAITALDIGLISRNLLSRDITESVIASSFLPSGKFVDFGGGYGMFVRLMRDYGFDFYRSDPFCQNLFAESFDWPKELSEKAEMLTAWEVFEHLKDPITSINEMLGFSDSILFSTTLVPASKIASANDWWYFIPETGQHISLFTKKSLLNIANQLGLTFYTDGSRTHLFTRRKMKDPFNPRIKWRYWRVFSKIRRFCNSRLGYNASFQEKDYETIRNRLHESNVSSKGKHGESLCGGVASGSVI